MGRGTRRRVTLGASLVPMVLAWAIGVARTPLTDNSFLTHLATGRLILDDGRVPTGDPYSFTAPGVDWVVQSWLASVVYAGAERLGGGLGLRLVAMSSFVAAALLMLRLARPARGLLVRMGIVFTGLAIGAGNWSARPYMVGVIGLALLGVLVDRDDDDEPTIDPPLWLLVPILWIWSNAHGSFPMAPVFVAAVAAGRRLDHRPVGRELRIIGWTMAGIAASTVGPLLHRGLLFPTRALSHRDVLTKIVEWQAPEFTSWSERAFLLLTLITLAALVRRPRWAGALPVLLFVAAALVARRNIVLATMVLVPVAARGFGDLGDLRVDGRPPLARALAAAGAAAVAVAALATFTNPSIDLAGYPERPIAYMGADGFRQLRVATADLTGNLLTVLDGTDRVVFVDDRVDMYPVELIEDEFVLFRADPAWDEVLDRYAIDAVIWDRTGPLSAVLVESDTWRTVLADPEWTLFCRRGPACDRLDPGSR